MVFTRIASIIAATSMAFAVINTSSAAEKLVDEQDMIECIGAVIAECAQAGGDQSEIISCIMEHAQDCL